MDIQLNRRSPVALRDQLSTQIELAILRGAVQPGQKLPSVRTLARQLQVHANTVAAAYRRLQDCGHVQLKRGSGIVVLGDRTGISSPTRSLERIILDALETAFARGFTESEIRRALARWLTARPVDRLLVIDADRDTAELLAAELRSLCGVSVAWAPPEKLRHRPTLGQRTLLLAVPYHMSQVRRLMPEADFEVLTLEMGETERRAIAAVPEGALVVVVSHARTVLPFATVLLRSLRGDEILVETCALADKGGLARLTAAADLVLADVLAYETVLQEQPRAVREYRIISAEAQSRVLQRLRQETSRG
jgi:GntR family transcriptional regulator